MSKRLRASGPYGFTMVELLVSMAVLSLIVVLVSQIVNSTSKAISTRNLRGDADAEARSIFSRMEHDFNGVVKRTDVDYYLDKKVGNDQLAFYSEASGYYLDQATVQDRAPVSVIGYRVLNNGLQRLGKGLVWNGVSQASGTAPVYLPLRMTSTWPQIAGNGTDPDYQSLGNEVYRFEFCYLLKDGTLSGLPTLKATSDANPAAGANGLKDVSAIVVSLAILDSKSRLMTSDLAAAVAKLPDAPDSQTLTAAPATTWQAQVDSGNLGIDAKAAASQVRIYQRYFYLDPIR